MAVAVCVPLLALVPHPATAAAPTATVGPVHVDVFTNASGAVSYPATGLYVFSAGGFSNLTFNPPSGATACGPHSLDRPFNFVDPVTCIARPLQNASGTAQAGVDNSAGGGFNLLGFEAQFASSITVDAAGSVTLTALTDDGSVVGFGADAGGRLPTSTQNCGGTTGTYQFHLLDCGNNYGHSPSPYNFVITFPEAGTYPIEVDYEENGGSAQGNALSMTLEVNGVPMAPATGAPPPQATVAPVQVDVFTNPSGRPDFPVGGPDGAFAFTAGPYSNLTFNPPNNPPAGSPGNSAICPQAGTSPPTDYANNRPMDFIDPFTCTAQHLQSADGSAQAGVNRSGSGGPNLTAFEAEFTSAITVDAAGVVSFTALSDDGQLIGFGTDASGHQPVREDGSSCIGPPTPKKGYKVIECSANGQRGATNHVVAVFFPAAGTYPIEVDYAENSSAPLVMTIEADHAPMVPTPTPNPSIPDGPPIALLLSALAGIGGVVFLRRRRRPSLLAVH